jgi:hypothetical protein
MALYSASAVDLATVLCLFDSHDIGEHPRKIQKPVVDFLVVGHLPQSLSQ